MATGSAAKRHRAHDAITIGDEMKRYEEEACSSIVDLQRPCVVRLDGHCFHTYTKGFRRPYDLRIHEAMVATATDLLERFGAVTAYTESDEISLLFPPSTAESPSLPFSGRVQKIVSVSAGFASARFNLHMASQPFDGEGEAPLAARVARSDAHFDSRVFSLPDEARLVEYMRWRALLDCRRNSISMLAQAHFPPARLHKLDAQAALRLLKEEKGVDWAREPAFFRFGTYVKKEQFTKEAFNPITRAKVTAVRTRCAARSFEFQPSEALGFLLTRFWPEELSPISASPTSPRHSRGEGEETACRV